jgi:hypothetical protein
VPTAGGTPQQITTGDGIENVPVALASGKRIAVLSADAKRRVDRHLANPPRRLRPSDRKLRSDLPDARSRLPDGGEESCRRTSR